MAKTADSPVILQALTSFAGDIDGIAFMARKGETIEADHPAVRKWPKYFGPLVAIHRTPRLSQPEPLAKEGA